MRNFDFCGNFKKIIIAPIVLIIAGIVLFFVMGLNIGVDFSGGSLIYAEIGTDKFTVDEVREIVNKYTNNATVSYSGADNIGVDIRLGGDDNAKEVQDKIINDIEEKYDLSYEMFDVEYVGAVIGKGLIVNALWALLIAFVLMLGYIWFRFEILSGVAALVGLFHDVCIMFVFVILLQTQINTPFIAAVLTIIGYSINNTIIIFDRIRSNREKLSDKPSLAEVVNISIKETFGRSVNTTVTTLIALVVLYILGVESIKTFVIPIIIGLFAGFYSSVFVTGPLWVIMNKGKKNGKKKKAAVNL